MQQDSKLDHLRHSLAHLLAAAVLDLWPETKRAIGPAIDNGFYYDLDFAQPLSETDLPKIEKKMRQILQTWKEFSHREVTPAEAREVFANEPYKLELIEEFATEGKTLTLYTSGDYVDLCKGGHVESAREIKPDTFKLTHLAGAYWRGDEKKPMLTRIYGLAFETKEALDTYITMIEEAKKRDHKKLGPELELFMFHHTSPGMPYWLPKGVVLYNELIRFWREEHKHRGYQEIVSPLLNKKELYITSGHYEHYWPDMFVANMGENEEYALKAMNCPNAMVVFGSKPRSYRELPLRLSDTDTLHRFERSGTLNGLLRVREFRQDDAHIFIPEEEIGNEYKRVFEIVERFYSIFGLHYSFRLGTRPESFMGDQATWDKAEATLKDILASSGKDYFVLEGDGAFYGPKVDILMKDALGREWQMGTIQLDFQQPRRFNLEYAAADGTKKTPVAIHRVIYGSMERFIGIIIEHFAGAFPLWLSPVQVAVLPISEKHLDHAEAIRQQLEAHDIRVEVSTQNETIGKKIRASEMQKVPYLILIGDKEIEANVVAVRHHGQGDIGQQSLADFIEKITSEIKEKK